MEFKFLGGAEEVGRLGLFIKVDKLKLLFDYGFNPDNPPQYPLPAPEIDHAFITHSHVDHCGLIPLIARRDIPIYGTSLTKYVTKVLTRDSVKISRSEGYPEPYNFNDIDTLMKNYKKVRYGDKIKIGDTEIEVFNAGHIPGASMYLIKNGIKVLFTGDININDTDLVSRCDVPKADVLIVEATYAGRNHPPRKDTESRFLELIDKVINAGGKVIIPAFAVGRTQEILMILHKLKYEIWLDGMGKTISDLYLISPEYIHDISKLKKSLKNVNFVDKYNRINLLDTANIIVTTSGMLDGGPALFYLDRLKNDPNSAVLLTGFQVPGSNGNRLIESGEMNIDGLMVRPKFKVEKFNFSAHVDNNGLLDFIRKVDPKKVILMHSDNRAVLADQISAEYEVLLPNKNEKFVI
ncbi:MAG: MBL fold metallo-hydrolase [Candidatus Thermoplasmatota archaeon]|nr:MBL fold metallo-hydrolase [Candidatus Thermoplasmatota archaeon]